MFASTAKSLLESTSDRRATCRYPFTTGVTAIDPISETEIDAHTTDICAGGCYVDTMNPFPSRTAVHLRLTRNGKSFHTKAHVAHCQTGVGMGLLFTNIAPAQAPILKRWLAELEGPSPSEVSITEVAEESHRSSEPQGGERYMVEELIAVLAQKHVLTEDEAETILRRCDS